MFLQFILHVYTGVLWFAQWCCILDLHLCLFQWYIVGFEAQFSSLCFPGGSEVKASASNAGDPGSIPGSGRSPGEGNGNPLQYSCLENPMDGESQERRSLVGYSPQGRKESDTTERLHFSCLTASPVSHQKLHTHKLFMGFTSYYPQFFSKGTVTMYISG